MDPRDAFLRAIEADPRNDAPRLVFADWLEENGERDRAHFIRLQCEHARIYDKYRPKDTPESDRLKKEIDALLKEHEAEWRKGLGKWAKDLSFERGFLNLYSMTAKQFL